MVFQVFHIRPPDEYNPWPDAASWGGVATNGEYGTSLSSSFFFDGISTTYHYLFVGAPVSHPSVPDLDLTCN